MTREERSHYACLRTNLKVASAFDNGLANPDVQERMKTASATCGAATGGYGPGVGASAAAKPAQGLMQVSESGVKTGLLPLESSAANVAPNTNSPYVLFNKTHKDSLPVPKGTGPNGGRLQSHHGLQQEWAANNIPNYEPKLAPTITIETGKGFPHTAISNLQYARRDARVAAGLGKWSSTIDEELGYIVSDFRAAGFSDGVIRQTLEQNYQMLDKLGVKYNKPAGF